MKKLAYLTILGFIVFVGGCGWGWLVPYSFQPSYWEFKKMCELNELPNNEEKYNKILGYFDLSLDSLDWEGLNKKTWKIKESNGNYKKGVFEYATLSKEKRLNSRAEMVAVFLSNESPINRYNINAMSISISWDTRRYVLDGNEGSGLDWYEEWLGCSKIAQENMTPKGFKNE